MTKVVYAAALMIFVFSMIQVIGSGNASEGLIQHSVVDRDELGSAKLSLSVEVPLVGERLPTEGELADISNHLMDSERPHDRTFVVFYLPGMEHGAGAFATGHHNPDLKVEILHYMLAPYPQYAKFAQ